MEAHSKHWPCQPADGHGPEDLSRARQPPATDHLATQPKNGLDQRFVQHVEDVICENSRQTILHILDEVTRLTSIEKLLLYLKLPTDLNNVSDPLRQPLNPLGSRTEISQTIMWIRTHLEEDPELSLPKQEVYNEYTLYCANNNMKPLSTADFGKVMKQVYPSVRPRRLGTRGNSRYCYAGLHKRFKLESPQLPDLCDRPKSTETICSSGDLISAAWAVVREWAETVLSMQFQNVYVLAKYLVKNVLVNSNSMAASLISAMMMEYQGKDMIVPEMEFTALGSLKHKETQMQLQRKLHQREVLREQKRKLQLQSPKMDMKGKCKKSKLQSNALRDPQEPEKPQGYQPNQVCDKASEQPVLPNFSSFQKKQDEGDETVDKPAEETKPNVVGKLPIPRLPAKLKVSASVKSLPARKCVKGPKYKAIQPKPAKRDENTQGTKQANIEMDGTVLEQLHNTDYLTRERLISVSNVDKDALDDYLHGGNNSQEQEEELMQYFKNTSEMEMQGRRETDEQGKCDKLSQLRLLLEQNLKSDQKNESTKYTSAKLPMSLPQNLILAHGVKRRVSFETSVVDSDTVPPSPNTRRKNFSFTPISPGPLSPGGLPSKCSSTTASPFVSPRNTPVPRAKMHVPSTTGSFVARKPLKPTLKTTIKHESEIYGESEKLFSDYIEEKHFVSPTDLMPKCNLTMSAPPSPMLPYKSKPNNTNLLQKLLDSSSKVPYVPDYDKNLTKQPPSFDNLSQEVSQLLSENNQCFTESSYRSQSVPLHQMTSFKTLISPCVPTSQQTHFNFNFISANNSVVATPVPNEFSDFEPFSDPDGLLNNGLNNENINQILNILETPASLEDTSPLNSTENIQAPIFPFDGSNLNPILENNLSVPETSFISQPRDLEETQIQPILSKIGRSQSIDVDMDLRGICMQKFNQPSRSVPNTPLPYTKLDTVDLNLNNNNSESHFGNEELSIALFNQDFLLNGQPVKEKFNFDKSLDPPQQMEYRPEVDKNERVTFGRNVQVCVDNFGARRNLNPLLEQQYSDTDEFTTVVPNTNT